MLITEEFKWDHQTFEAYVEGMRLQVAAHPSERIPFLAFSSPLSILTFFACWKEGKIACPLNPKLPSTPSILKDLRAPLFTPSMPVPAPSTPPEWNLDNLATFILTSGSSGKPKIACHTLKNHVLNAQGSNLKIPLDSQSCWGLSIPLYHVGGIGILFRCYLAKASILLSKTFAHATHLSLVPTQLYRIIKENTHLPHLQTLLLGGAPIPPIQTRWNILPTYGMTEMCSQIVTNHTLNPHAEMTFSHDKEIWVRGATLFQGYLQEDGSIARPLNCSDWFETKDLGEWKEGRFQIIGRKDNLFISGGENIQPEEIEAAIFIHCRHEEALVVPLKDEEFGHRPGVYLQDPSLLPLIQAQLLEVLPKFKIPIRAFPFPPTAGLKPNRKYLQQLAESAEIHR
jgi:o-succinylbenzoate---CoA ligase